MSYVICHLPAPHQRHASASTHTQHLQGSEDGTTATLMNGGACLVPLASPYGAVSPGPHSSDAECCGETNHTLCTLGRQAARSVAGRFTAARAGYIHAASRRRRTCSAPTMQGAMADDVTPPPCGRSRPHQDPCMRCNVKHPCLQQWRAAHPYGKAAFGPRPDAQRMQSRTCRLIGTQ